jgi:hypothetical protein
MKQLVSLQRNYFNSNATNDVMVYKVGDTYVAARSNEFGYANYELQRSE